MSDEEWDEARVRSLGMLLNGQLMDEWDERGKHIHDDILLLLLNANADDIPFVLPKATSGQSWEMLLDTALPDGKELPWLRPGKTYLLQGRSLALLRQRAPEV
jgi:isoamylase